MRRAEPRAREHRDGDLGHHAHVDGDAVALLDAELARARRRGAPTSRWSSRVGERAASSPSSPSQTIAALLRVARGEVPIEAALGDVERRADEPLRVRELPLEQRWSTAFSEDERLRSRASRTSRATRCSRGRAGRTPRAIRCARLRRELRGGSKRRVSLRWDEMDWRVTHVPSAPSEALDPDWPVAQPTANGHVLAKGLRPAPCVTTGRSRRESRGRRRRRS